VRRAFSQRLLRRVAMRAASNKLSVGGTAGQKMMDAAVKKDSKTSAR
jgi:hypothetical protein